MSGTITDLTPTHNRLKVILYSEEVNWRRYSKKIFFLTLKFINQLARITENRNCLIVLFINIDFSLSEIKDLYQRRS